MFLFQSTKSKSNSIAARELIRRGANVNQQDAEKQTALSSMMSADDRATMNALIDARADPNIPGRYGRTVIETLAIWEGSTSLIRRFGESVLDMVKKNGWNAIAAKIEAVQKAQQPAIPAPVPVATPAAVKSATPPAP